MDCDQPVFLFYFAFAHFLHALEHVGAREVAAVTLVDFLYQASVERNKQNVLAIATEIKTYYFVDFSHALRLFGALLNLVESLLRFVHVLLVELDPIVPKINQQFELGDGGRDEG